jgi:hypothetical protein
MKAGPRADQKQQTRPFAARIIAEARPTSRASSEWTPTRASIPLSPNSATVDIEPDVKPDSLSVRTHSDAQVSDEN